MCAATEKGLGPEGRSDLRFEMTEDVGHDADYLLTFVEQEVMLFLNLLTTR